MIRVPVTVGDLEAAIEKQKPGWLARAREATKALAGVDDPEFADLWGDVKDVYAQIQASKCGFCEKLLEGRIEQDVEHFRPKAEVRAWKVPAAVRREIAAAGFRVVQPRGGPEPGYRLLAYHHLNYVTACKNCNSIRKRNYFPIAGRRKRAGRDPTGMAGERAYLIYPLSDIDEDPEDLIGFHGGLPRPRPGLPAFSRLRALVTIDLFGLDDPDARKGLLIDRMLTLEKVFLALRGRQDFRSQRERDAAQVVIDRYTSGRFPHTNCARCFVRVFERSRDEATRLYEAVASYLKSVST